MSNKVFRLTRKEIDFVRERALAYWKEIDPRKSLWEESKPLNDTDLNAVAWIQAVSELLAKHRGFDTVDVELSEMSSEPSATDA